MWEGITIREGNEPVLVPPILCKFNVNEYGSSLENAFRMWGYFVLFR